jgi:hypothetical protein
MTSRGPSVKRRLCHSALDSSSRGGTVKFHRSSCRGRVLIPTCGLNVNLARYLVQNEIFAGLGRLCPEEVYGSHPSTAETWFHLAKCEAHSQRGIGVDNGRLCLEGFF